MSLHQPIQSTQSVQPILSCTDPHGYDIDFQTSWIIKEEGQARWQVERQDPTQFAYIYIHCFLIFISRARARVCEFQDYTCSNEK